MEGLWDIPCKHRLCPHVEGGKTNFSHNRGRLLDEKQTRLLNEVTRLCFILLPTQTLPVSQACGFILGYEIKLSYGNGTTLSVNVSTAEPGSQLVCAETHCHFNSSIEEVTSVSVSAYNAHGGTTPSYLNMPTSGINF